MVDYISEVVITGSIKTLMGSLEWVSIQSNYLDGDSQTVK